MPLAMVALLVAAGLMVPQTPSDSDESFVDLASFVPRGLVQTQSAIEFGADDDIDEGVAWIRAYHDSLHGSFEVVRGDRRLAAGENYRFVVLDRIPMSGEPVEFFPEQMEDEADKGKAAADPSVTLTDVTGDGVPEGLVYEWSGGAHCCFALRVFQFVPTFRAQRIDAGDSDYGVFDQLDEDPALEISLPDWTFAYWETSFAQSPVAFVALDFDGESWRPSARLMRTPPPDTLDEAGFAARWKRWQADEPEPSGEWVRAPWEELLLLIYSGNATQAWRLLDAGWPGDAASKAEFRAKLLEQLQHSVAWPTIVELNGAALHATSD